MIAVLFLQRSFLEMQSWIQELRQLGPPNLVLAITGNKLDMEESRQVMGEREREREREVYNGRELYLNKLKV